MLSSVSLFMVVSLINLSHATNCNTKFSDASFLREFGLIASSETSKNRASDVFTVGWCASTNTGSPSMDVDFKLPYGISGISVSGPTNRDGNPYPTNVLVKYVPNGGDGNNFIHFPLQEGKLEIKMTKPGTVQTNFGQGIAARKLQFIIQSFHGDACLKIDLIGCRIYELCTGGCQQNGGLCIMQDTCQCPQGTLGDNCELLACVPADLGLADGRIAADHITVSSQDPTYNKAEIGNNHSPFVQIKLDQPKAVSVFDFMWSGRGGNTILTEFELQYIAAVDSSRRFRTFATDIPAMNGTHVFSVTIQPVLVTDTIRIIPSKWEDIPCFKLEIMGCDPKALCSANWCMNRGTCMGENVCICPSGFVGSRCDITVNEITVANMTFVKIEHNTIITTTPSLQFEVTGNVKLEVIANKPVVTINGTDSCITLNQTSGTPSCVSDVNHCTNGFTFTVDINFGHLIDNTYIVSSGGNLPDHSGITLYYVNKQLHYIVSTTTQTWTVVVNYLPVLRQWQHFELTWNKHLGIEILVNGHSLGSNTQSSNKPTSSKTDSFAFGCSHSSNNVNIDMQITAINSWSLDRTELVNAGVKEPPVTTIVPPSTAATAKPSTAATTSAPATTKPSTMAPATTKSSTPAPVTTKMMTTTSTTYRYSEAYMSLKPTADTTSSVPQWKFEDAIRANCTSSGWNISMDLHKLQVLYPGITANDIYLSPAKCHGSRYNDKLWFQQRFNTCMTTEKDSDGTAIFQNSLFYAVFDPIDPTIVRRHVWTYTVACYLSKQESASAHLHHEVENHSTNVTGHHDIALTFYRDPNFLHRITGDPLRVSVGDNIYVKVATSVPDFDTKLRLHTCYTRTSEKAVEHLLIRDGCEVDSSTHIISQSTHETKFVFRDIEYLTFNEGLDIYCNATFCDSTDYTPSCTQACRQGPSLVG